MNGQPFSPGLFAVAQLFAKAPNARWEKYQQSRGFSKLHGILLCIKPGSGTLGDYLKRAMEGTTLDLIDATDALGRSEHSWAVEYDWVDTAVTLMKLGGNVHQNKCSVDGGLSMLHRGRTTKPSALLLSLLV
jgi:hypothetical protein